MPAITKPDFLEYFEDATGKVHILNVFCKGCGAPIQTGHLMKNHVGVSVPVLVPSENYVDMYISFEDADGILHRKSTPMCGICAAGYFSQEDLGAIHAADNAVMRERHAQSGVKDPKVDDAMKAREKMRMLAKIGQASPGYVIVGEGR